MLHFRSKPLPELAEKFLAEMSAERSHNTISLYRAALHHFFRFLAQSKLNLANLGLIHIKEFDEDLERHHLKISTRLGHRKLVHGYMRWLEKEGHLPEGTSRQLFPDYKIHMVQATQAPLPELAQRFLKVLEASSQPNTVNGYKSCLRGFYRVQWKADKPPYKITRADIDAYMVYLKERGLQNNSREERLFQLRRYLDWLFDHKKLKTHPDELMTGNDFPRRQYNLPRPFPPEIDLEIQRRLEASSDIDHLGLLLMRRCGLRISEMRSLTLECIGQDELGNWHLKVPMVKLHMERIFPLDPKTVQIIERIKLHHSGRVERGTGRKFLISAPSGRRRGPCHFAPILQDITRDLAIAGRVEPHRLRHSFATSLLSAGMSLTCLKTLLGHKDIRMTLSYAAVTQESVRREYFTALTKLHSRYDVAAYPLKAPDLRTGVNRAFYDVQASVKKFVKEHGNPDSRKLTRLCYRLMSLRHEFSTLLRLETPEK